MERKESVDRLDHRARLDRKEDSEDQEVLEKQADLDHRDPQDRQAKVPNQEDQVTKDHPAVMLKMAIKDRLGRQEERENQDRLAVTVRKDQMPNPVDQVELDRSDQLEIREMPVIPDHQDRKVDQERMVQMLNIANARDNQERNRRPKPRSCKPQHFLLNAFMPLLEYMLLRNSLFISRCYSQAV
jgi:hypothetical protein